MSTSTFAFALALGAVVCAALAWITSLRLKLELESWRSTSVSNYKSLVATTNVALKQMQTLARELEAKTPEKLAAEVAALSEAVAKVADTQRRFAGRFDMRMAQLGLRKSSTVVDGEVERVETPDEVRARLRLQHGLPKVGAGAARSE